MLEDKIGNNLFHSWNCYLQVFFADSLLQTHFCECKGIICPQSMLTQYECYLYHSAYPDGVWPGIMKNCI